MRDAPPTTKVGGALDQLMIEFFQVVEGGIPPCRASKSANGTIPTNGFRYCEPVRTASAFGCYVFLPIEFRVIWTGDEIHWSMNRGADWYLLDDAIQYPDFREGFDRNSPDAVTGYSPPFLTRTNDRDIVQIWTGCFVRTRDGCSVWVREPVNLPREDMVVLEGVVQTDWWFGPLFANVRLRRKNEPVLFRCHEPFLQIMPFERRLSDEFNRTDIEVHSGLDTLTNVEWDAYERTIVNRMRTRTRLGQYAVEARRRSALSAEGR